GPGSLPLLVRQTGGPGAASKVRRVLMGGNRYFSSFDDRMGNYLALPRHDRIDQRCRRNIDTVGRRRGQTDDRFARLARHTQLEIEPLLGAFDGVDAVEKQHRVARQDLRLQPIPYELAADRGIRVHRRVVPGNTEVAPFEPLDLVEDIGAAI